MTDEQTPPRRLDPAVAHRIDARTLLALAPYLDQGDLPEVRMLLARQIQAGRPRQNARYTTWQDAWNDLAGATVRGAGILTYTPARCKKCHGRKFDRRTGTACMECMGRGRARHPERLAVRYATPPTMPVPLAAPTTATVSTPPEEG